MLSVAVPFVWCCPSNQTINPFPHPTHRTGRPDFPYPALGRDNIPFADGTRCNDTQSKALYQDRSTAIHAVVAPVGRASTLRHPTPPGLSLTGVLLSISRHGKGLPVLRTSLVYMLSPLPRNRDEKICASTCTLILRASYKSPARSKFGPEKRLILARPGRTR